MPSANMFLPRRGFSTRVRHCSSIGTLMKRRSWPSSSFMAAFHSLRMSSSSCFSHMLSMRTIAPSASAPARKRFSSTCSLNATTRFAASPQLVTSLVPRRMRLPLAEGGVRAGGWISAGMISTVHTPLPMRAETRPKICPQRCAPSPESDTTSTVCSGSVMTLGPLAFLAPFLAFFLAGALAVEEDGVISHSRSGSSVGFARSRTEAECVR